MTSADRPGTGGTGKGAGTGADDLPRFEPAGETTVHRGRIITVVRATFVDPDGTTFERDVVRHPGEAVNGHQVLPPGCGQQAQRHREVLAGRPGGHRVSDRRRVAGSPGRRLAGFPEQLLAHSPPIASHGPYFCTVFI